MAGIGEQNRVAIGGGARDRLRRNEPACAGAIGDDDLLTKSLR